MGLALTRLFWVSLGGALGTALRFLVQAAATATLGASFPYGTLAVNVIGSALLGALMQLGPARDAGGETMRLALTTGVLGGFTTYSAFNYEATRYFRDGAWPLATAYVAGTIALCLAAGLAGAAAARAATGGN
jgi:CrcB protein